jgi:hypothetical protein
MNPNPSEHSLMARRSLALITSSEGYWGRSSWLKQVCAVGSSSGSNALWTPNRCTPSEPCSAANPSRGTYSEIEENGEKGGREGGRVGVRLIV